MREETWLHRGEYDLYTGKHRDDVDRANVDHIIETQMVVKAALFTTHGDDLPRDFIDPLRRAINPRDCENYNVTTQRVNVSKGQAVRAFLAQAGTVYLNPSLDFRGVLFQEGRRGYACREYQYGIASAILDTVSVVAGNVREARREGYVDPLGDDIASVLEDIVEEMNLTAIVDS
jgi:hypothetical protein